MRNTLLAIVVAVLPASIALAEPSSNHKPDKATLDRLLPLRGAAGSNSCAAYGPGFVKVDGTGTCVKIGGAVSIGAGTAGGWR
jgi:predicted secreted protein